MSQAPAVVAYRIGGFVSDEKPENRLLHLFAPELFSAQSREQLVDGLRARADRFYQQATLEEIIEARRLIELLLEARGLLAQRASSQAH